MGLKNVSEIPRHNSCVCSESNPIICQKQRNLWQVWQSFCYVSVNIRHVATFFRWYIPPSSCLAFVSHLFTQYFHHVSLSLGALKNTVTNYTAQLTSSATKDMPCVSGSTQSPLPSIRRTLATCHNTQHKSWLGEQWCARSHGSLFKTLRKYIAGRVRKIAKSHC